MQLTAPHIDKPTLLHVIDHLTTAIILVDQERRVLLANQMAARLAQQSKPAFYALRAGEALGCVNAHLTPEGCGHSPTCGLCSLKHNVEETFASRSVVAFFETRMELNGHGQRDLRVSSRYLMLDRTEAVLISIEDFTEMRAKAQLEKENAQLAAVIETAGAVCHELNQPMMVLFGHMQLLLEESPGAAVIEHLRRMQTAIDGMQAITHRLMCINAYQTKSYAGTGLILDIERSSRMAEIR